MDKIIAHLTESLADGVLSKAEKKSLKTLVAEQSPDQDQLNFLRSKIYELANERVTDVNYRFILEWVRNANSALVARSAKQSEAFFSPGEACRNVIINQLNNAINSVKICVFTISDDLITDAIVISHKNGVDVTIITDNDKLFDVGSDIGQLAREGIVIKTDNTSNHMHHKFMIVDDRTLVSGSYNWTRSAVRFNQENILLTSEAGVVKSFLKEFERLWLEMDLYVTDV